ncbi:hypothetical protein ABLE93_23770 [Xanthobacter sp. KR7-65]|uniref:hypothetical protein n=1 Tax=Xanthobacter sp. KR7-65 TaxID=3156612 RepID=UPI0032B61601
MSAAIAAPVAASLALATLLPGTAQAHSFGNDEQSCVYYGDWAVCVIDLAASQGCDVKRAKDVLVPGPHAQWCMRQSAASVARATQVHRTGVVDRCAKQGASVKINI